MSGLTGQVGTAMAWSVFARVGRFVLGLASSIIVVHALGADDYGVLSLVRNLLMFAVIIAGGGLGNAVLKFLPALRVEGDAVGARRLVRTALAVNMLLWVVAVAVFYLGRGLVERVFPYEHVGVVVAAAAALALFEVFFTLLSRILEASYDTRRLAAASLLSHVVYIVGLAVVLPRGWGVLGVVGAAAVGNAVACLILIPRLAVAVASGQGGADEAHVDGRRLFRFSAPFVAIGILNLIVWRQSEVLFLAHFRTAAETGIFDLAYRLPQTMLEFVPMAVWPLVLAGFSEAFARDRANLRIAIDRYYRMLFLLCAPIWAVGIVVGGKMMTILYPTYGTAAAVPTQVFFAIFAVSFFGTPLSMSLYVLEKTHVNLIVYLCLAVVNVGLDLLLIPRYGVAGAIAPVALVTAATPVIYRVLAGRYIDGIQIPWGFVARCFAASCAALLVAPFLRFVNGLVGLVAAVLAATILIVLAFRFLRVLTGADMEMLKAVPIPLANRLLKFIGGQ
jgi:O-antigen/teichoic acid export membrane protein